MSAVVKTILIVLAVLLALCLVLSFKLKLVVIYKDGNTRVFLKYLFLKFPLLQDRKKKIKQKEKKPKKAAKQPKKTSKSKKDFFESMSDLLSLVSSGGRILRLAVSLHKADVRLKIAVSDEDAAKTAIAVGTTSGGVHTLLALLSNLCEIKKKDIEIYPDYNGDKTRYDLLLTLYTRPLKFIFNIHKFLKELLVIAEALPQKSKGE